MNISVPRVSILIPVYNRDALIGPCIQSAIDQTISDIEIIVIDNASTDNTWEVCKSFAARDPRVRIFRNETNIGPVRNWQRCIDEARADIGKIIFSDDLIDPTFLEKTLHLLDDADVGFVFTSTIMGSEPWMGKVLYEFAEKTGKYLSLDFITESFLAVNVPHSPGCAIFRIGDLKENLLEEIPSPIPRNFLMHGAGTDLLIYLLTARKYQKIAFVAEPLSFFRAHEGSISVSDKNYFIVHCYRQARLWFAGRYLNNKMSRKIFALEWRREYHERKFFLLPSAWWTRYTTDNKPMNLSDIVWIIFYELIMPERIIKGKWLKCLLH
ncbi:MAG: glycosyltransferase family 2 protein [Desulfuromonadales bacterium]|nr:glycosyltransferase family 2 protein [Desulfuromonadales bacterium]